MSLHLFLRISFNEKCCNVVYVCPFVLGSKSYIGRGQPHKSAKGNICDLGISTGLLFQRVNFQAKQSRSFLLTSPTQPSSPIATVPPIILRTLIFLPRPPMISLHMLIWIVLSCSTLKNCGIAFSRTNVAADPTTCRNEFRVSRAMVKSLNVDS